MSALKIRTQKNVKNSGEGTVNGEVRLDGTATGADEGDLAVAAHDGGPIRRNGTIAGEEVTLIVEAIFCLL